MSGHTWCEMGKRRFTVMRPRIGGGHSRVATVESESVARFLCETLDNAEQLRNAVKEIGAALPVTLALPPAAAPGLNLPPLDVEVHEAGADVIPMRPMRARS